MTLVLTQGDPLQTEVYQDEAYVAGLFWTYPELYEFYSVDKINMKTFANRIWGFYFCLGRDLATKGIKVFDEWSVIKHVKDLGIEGTYEQFKGYSTIATVMSEVRGKQDNLDAYLQNVFKYAMLRNLREMFGDVVIQTEGKYDYKKLTGDEIHTWWVNKVNQISVGMKQIDEHYLLDGLREAIDEWDQNPSMGLPFYDSENLTKICNGWDYSNVYISGMYSGKGKTSFVINKIFLSCLEYGEPLLVIANEQGVSEFRQMLLITVMGVIANKKYKETGEYVKHFDRKRLNEGNFTLEERAMLEEAVEWIEQLTNGNTKVITFVAVEDYNIDAVKTTIRHYAMRGIRRVIIDTAKPTDGSPDMARWQRFAQDFEEIYRLARSNGGGLNLAIWTNVQLGDNFLGNRFLNEKALGDSKKIKNVSSVVFLSRNVHDDEYEGERNELTVWRYIPKEPHEMKDGEKPYKIKEFKLDKRHGPFSLLFTAKNRRGRDNVNGEPVLVFKPDLNSNTWKEVGFTRVPNDNNY